MLDNVLQGVYDKLKPKADKDRKYSKIGNAIFILYMIVFIVVFFMSSYAKSLWNLEPSVFLGVTLLIWVVFFALTLRTLGRKYRKYSLTVDERSVFLACSILKNLEQYSDTTQNKELREEHKEKAVEDAKDLLSIIDSNWTVGDFKLAKRIFKDTISKFKKNLRTRLIPNLEKLDEKRLEKVESTVYNIAYVIYESRIDVLNNLNDSIFLQLDEYSPSKAKFLSRLVNYLQIHRILRHVLIVIGIGGIAILTYAIGNYVGATTSVSYATAFSLFGILLVGYLNYLRRETPKAGAESKP